jgi:hypothetical protein
MAEPTVQELQKQLEDLNKKLKEAGGLGIDLQAAFRNAGDDTKKLNEYIAQLNKQYEELVDNADYVYRTFQDISAELKNQNLLLKIGKGSFKGFTDIAQDLNSYQKGYNDLTDIKFKKLKNNLALEKNELEFAVARLKASENERRREVERLNNLLAQEDISSKQRKYAENRLKELDKENKLLVDAKEALKSGIPILEKELDLTKQIANTRRDLGGLSQAAGKLVSEYGGSLAKFLNVSEATEAVEEFNKKLIQDALSTKEVKDQLLDVEIKRKKIEEDYANGLLTELEYLEQIKKQEEESYAIKQKAIASTNNLGNKFKSLGIFVAELGVGYKKALEDPATIIKFIVDKALEANKQAVELGKSLGYGAENSNALRENLALTAGFTANINVNSQSLTAAFGELATATGYVAEFSADALETQVMLTKQFKLTAEEAAGVYKFSLLTGKSSKEVNDEMVGAFVATRNSLKAGVPFKAAIAEAAKVSGALASSFQNNPARITAAVVQVKALGTSLEQTAKQGEALLNFESSLENELKAELLTGKQLNLERARAAALAGDQVTLAQELAKNVGSIEEFDKMNILQKKALAEAAGLTTDELAKQLQNQKLAQETGKSLAQITKEQALEDQKRQDIQEKFAASLLKIQDVVGSLVAGPFGQLLDLISNIASVLTAVVSPVITSISYVVGLIVDGFKTISPILIGIGGLLGVMYAKSIALAIANVAQTAWSAFIGIPFAGPILATAATLAGVGLVKRVVKGDDVMSESGYGKRTLLAPEGAIKLNDKDTVIAGTDLGGGQQPTQDSQAIQSLQQTIQQLPQSLQGQQSIQQPPPTLQVLPSIPPPQTIQGPSIDLTPMIVAINEVKAAVDGLMNRPVVINMDSKQVGSNLVQGSYKLA